MKAKSISYCCCVSLKSYHRKMQHNIFSAFSHNFNIVDALSQIIEFVPRRKPMFPIEDFHNMTIPLVVNTNLFVFEKKKAFLLSCEGKPCFIKQTPQ